MNTTGKFSKGKYILSAASFKMDDKPYRKPGLPRFSSSSYNARGIPGIIICCPGWVKNAYISGSYKRLANKFSKIYSLIDTAYCKSHSRLCLCYVRQIETINDIGFPMKTAQPASKMR